jgi:hypothetical protein
LANVVTPGDFGTLLGITARGAAAGLLLAFGLAGCGTLASGPAETATSSVEVRAAPAAGMRASYQVKTVATLSGAGVRSLPESQKTATASQRYVVEVTAADADSFDVRVTTAGAPDVVVARFGRDWAPLQFGVEIQGRYSDGDLVSFPVLGEALQLSRDLSGQWRVGESRAWERVVNFPPLLSVLMRGTLTLKRVTSRDGRRAAEFAYSAAGDGQYQASPFRMSMAGQCWMDLATGFLLEVKTSAPGRFTRSGEPVGMEIKEERALDRPASRGF